MSDYTKHTTHTDALDTLGSIITENEKRDAIHLAVYPVQAGERLRPGEHVRLERGEAIGLGFGDQGIGIVDPFLDRNVGRGEWFWLVVYPRQISSLRHVWEHDAFPPSGETEQTKKMWIAPDIVVDARAAAEQWLRDWIGSSDIPSFELFVDAVKGGIGTRRYDEPFDHIGLTYEDDYMVILGSDGYGEIPSTVWDMMEVYLGTKVPARPSHFSCSC